MNVFKWIFKQLLSVKSLTYLKLGIIIYALGFIFMTLIGRNYTGVFSFLSPFCITIGIIFIAVSLAKKD